MVCQPVLEFRKGTPLHESAQNRAGHSQGFATCRQLTSTPRRFACTSAPSLWPQGLSYGMLILLVLVSQRELGQATDLEDPSTETKVAALQPEIWGSNPSSRLPSNLRSLWTWLNHLSALKPNAPERQVIFIFASSVPTTYMSTEWTTVQCWDRKAVLHACKVKV